MHGDDGALFESGSDIGEDELERLFSSRYSRAGSPSGRSAVRRGRFPRRRGPRGRDGLGVGGIHRGASGAGVAISGCGGIARFAGGIQLRGRRGLPRGRRGGEEEIEIAHEQDRGEQNREHLIPREIPVALLVTEQNTVLPGRIRRHRGAPAFAAGVQLDGPPRPRRLSGTGSCPPGQ